MKMKQITAILMSLSMAISTCLPLSGTTALAAEISGTVETTAVVEEEASDAELEDATADVTAEEEEPEETDSVVKDSISQEATDETTEENKADQKADPAGNDTAGYDTASQEESPETVTGATEGDTTAPSESEMEEIEESSETNDAAEGEGDVGRSYDNPIDITLGSEVAATISNSIGYYFRFIPEEDGPYDFCVTVETDGFSPHALLYNEEGWSMEAYLHQTDDYEFRLSAELTAGKAYCFSVDTFDEQGDVTVYVEYMLFEAEAAEYNSSYEADSPVTLKVNTQCMYMDQVKYVWCDNTSLSMEGETADSITFTLSEPGDYEYTCIVQFRDKTLYVSFPFEITDYLFEAEAAEYNSSYEADSPVTLKVNTQCAYLDEVTYEWYDNDNELIDGETAESISFTLDKPGNYEYSCIVKCRSKTATIKFPFEIKDYFKVSQNAKNFNVHYGDEVTMTVNAESGDTSNIHYSWRRSGRKFSDGSWEYYREELPENTNSITVTADLTAEYSCEVEMYGSSYKSEYCYFDLNVDDIMEAYPEGVHRDANGNMPDTIKIRPTSPEDLALKVVVRRTNTEELTFSWEKDEKQIKGETSDTLFLDRVKSGIYTCTVYDNRGNSRRVKFDVKYGSLTLLPKGSETVNGEREDILYIKTKGNYTPYKLETELIAADDAEVTYSWYNVFYEGSQLNSSKESYIVVGQNSEHPFTSKWICIAEDQYGNKDEACFNLSENFTRVTSPNGYLKYLATAYFYTISLPIERDERGEYIPLQLEASVEDATLPGVEYYWQAQNPFFDYSLMEIDGNKAIVKTAAPYMFEAYDYDHGNRAIVYFNVYDPTELSVYPEGSWSGGGEHDNHVTLGVNPGESLTLNVLSDEDSSGYTYTWYDSRNKEISEESMSSSLTISPEFSQMYTCEVKSEYGQIGHAYFYVTVENEFYACPVGYEQDPDHYDPEINLFTMEREKGETITLSVDASAANESGMTYNWKAHELNYEDYETGWQEISGGNENSIQVAPDIDTLYECEVTDAYHNISTVTFKVINVKTYELAEAEVILSCSEYIYDGQEARPTVRVEYYGSDLIEDTDYIVTYISSDLVSAGTKTVEITPAEGSIYKGSKTVTYVVNKAAQTMDAKIGTAKPVVGGSSKITVSDVKESAAITYKSSNNAIATVSMDGKVTAKKVGTAVITVTAAETDNYVGKSKTIKVTVLPAATTTLSAVAASNGKGIKLTWKKVTGATGYVIKRQAGSGAWKTIKTVGNVATYTDTGAATNGSKYTYQVYAKASTGTSTKYKSVVTYNLARPSVTAIENTAGRKLYLKWNKNGKANGYQIQYSLKSNFSGAKNLNVSKNSIVTRVIGNLTKGKTYYVRVRAYKKVSGKTYYSAWSAAKKQAISK